MKQTKRDLTYKRQEITLFCDLIRSTANTIHMTFEEEKKYI